MAVAISAAGGGAELALPSLPDEESAAHRAALREAAIANKTLEAKLVRTRGLLADAMVRFEAQETGKRAFSEQLGTMRELVEERRRLLDAHTQDLAARELRIRLSRQGLAESGSKLEELRKRGCLAEEELRVRSLQLGKASERLVERRQQLLALQRLRLQQRVRVGTSRWVEAHLQDMALQRWRERARALGSTLRDAAQAGDEEGAGGEAGEGPV